MMDTHREWLEFNRPFPDEAKCKKCGKDPGVQHHCDEFRCEAPLIEREIA
jgi:hypothetical protein